MAVSDEFKNRLGKLSTKLAEEPATLPMQKVEPVQQVQKKSVEEPEEEITQFNVKIPAALMKKIKLKAVEQDINIKDMVAQILIDHFKNL
jgi:predicted HicB family RNase H-like nuclease